MKDDHPTSTYKLDLKKAKSYGLKRGGRLGVTLETEYERETAKGHATMLAIGLFMGGWSAHFLAGNSAMVGIGGGAFLASVAFERASIVRQADLQDDSEAVDDE